MEQVLQDETLFSGMHPYPGKTIKRVTHDTIVYCLRLNDDTISKEDIIIELWTDIQGRHHGYEMVEKSKGYYEIVLHCKNPGFYNSRFRYRMKEHNYWTWISNEDSTITVDHEYIRKSIVYNMFIRFYGHKKMSDMGRVEFGRAGTFDDAKHRLDDIKRLGADILYLNPVHPIGELYRNYNPHDLLPSYLQPGCPYSIKDYKTIDPEIGIDKDHSQSPYKSLSDPMIEFKEFVQEAHKRGLKVFMDLVFNHTAHDFHLQRLHPEWFLYKNDIKSLEQPYLYPEDVKRGLPWGDAKHTFCPYDHGFFWEDAAQINWEYMLPKASNEPPPNPTINEMKHYFKSIPKYWIKHLGIDGFRCDVAYRIPPDFWRECISEAKKYARDNYPATGALYPDCIFIAESYVDNIPVLLESGFAAAYGDYSNKLYNVESLKGYSDYMYNLTGNYFPEGSLFFTFPECHDFHRNTKKMLGDDTDYLLAERANKSRWVLTCMMPGIPMLFNGFEKLEWQQVNLFSYSSIDWESDKDLTEYIMKVNRIRNDHISLQKGRYKYIGNSHGINSNAKIYSFMRMYDDERFIIIVNMDINNPTEAIVYLNDVSEIDTNRQYLLLDLLSSESYERRGDDIFVRLGPGESHIFKIVQ
ncbi:MAG: alpha-amylase family glycosyl hydrolase [Candidatus Woesearchaeota archaeon]